MGSAHMDHEIKKMAVALASQGFSPFAIREYLIDQELLSEEVTIRDIWKDLDAKLKVVMLESPPIISSQPIYLGQDVAASASAFKSLLLGVRVSVAAGLHILRGCSPRPLFSYASALPRKLILAGARQFSIMQREFSAAIFGGKAVVAHASAAVFESARSLVGVLFEVQQQAVDQLVLGARGIQSLNHRLIGASIGLAQAAASCSARLVSSLGMGLSSIGRICGYCFDGVLNLGSASLKFACATTKAAAFSISAGARYASLALFAAASGLRIGASFVASVMLGLVFFVLDGAYQFAVKGIHYLGVILETTGRVLEWSALSMYRFMLQSLIRMAQNSRNALLVTTHRFSILLNMIWRSLEWIGVKAEMIVLRVFTVILSGANALQPIVAEAVDDVLEGSRIISRSLSNVHHVIWAATVQTASIALRDLREGAGIVLMSPLRQRA